MHLHGILTKLSCTRVLLSTSIASTEVQRFQCLLDPMPHTNVGKRTMSSSVEHLYKNEEIPMPWGVIGARRWGDASKSPILLVHGWKDNLASFDRLIPLLLPKLKDQYYFLAIDLPGHGFSSHFPPGMMYQVSDCLLLFARIIRHYKWTQPINYMGHSFGAILGFIFSATNPGVIDRYVALDALTPFMFKSDEILSLIPSAISDSLKFEQKLSRNKRPLYSYDEIFQRLMHRNTGGLDETSAKILLSRGICEAGPGTGLFHFTHDIRVQYLPIMMLGTKQVAALANNFQSQILHIQAKDGVQYERPYIRKNVESWIRSNEKAKPDRDIRFIEIDGSHHIHLMTPERVVPHILEFLKH